MTFSFPRLQAAGQRPGAVLTFAFLWLIAEYVILGPYSYDFVQDGTDLFISGNMSVPYAGVTWPLWDNFTVGGTNRAALAYVGVIYTYLFSHIPTWLAHQIAIVAQIASGLFASYMLARRTFGFSREAALFVAVAYALLLTGSLINSVIAYLPLVLLATRELLDRKASIIRWVAAGAVVFAAADTAYFSRLVPFACVTVVAWFLFVDTRSKLSDWPIVLGVALALGLVRLETILALIAEAPASHLPLVRTTETPALVAEMALDIVTRPIHFISILGLATAVFLGQTGGARFWRVLGVAALGFALMPVGVLVLSALVQYLGHDFRGFRLHRFFLIPQTVLIFGSGYGIEALLGRLRAPADDFAARVSRRVLTGAAIYLAAVSIWNKSTVPSYWITHGNLVHNFDSPVLRDLAARLRTQPWPERVEPFQLYPAYLQAYGIETAGGNQPLIPRRYYEFWGAMVEPWLQRPSGTRGVAWWQHDTALLAETDGWPSYRGDRLLLSPDEHSSDVRLADFVRLNLLALANVGYVVSRDRITDEGFTLVQGIDRPWSSLSTAEKIKTNLRANFEGRTQLYIYRNQKALPRFFSVGSVSVANSGRAVVEAMENASLQTLRQTAFVEQGTVPATLRSGDVFAPLDITLEHYTSDEIRLVVNAPSRGLLVITNSYSKRWAATADGQPLELFPAYHAFWGVIIPAGTRSVTFRYR